CETIHVNAVAGKDHLTGRSDARYVYDTARGEYKARRRLSRWRAHVHRPPHQRQRSTDRHLETSRERVGAKCPRLDVDRCGVGREKAKRGRSCRSKRACFRRVCVQNSNTILKLNVVAGRGVKRAARIELSILAK